jgi:prepilin signal peptidase PulO-like enzyme (type II secretory pathway)
MDEMIRFFFFTGLALFIGIVDFNSQKIPNSLLLLLTGGLLGIDAFWNPGAIPYRLISGVSAFALFYIVYRIRGGLGFGDVKYAGVIGYFLGPGRVINGLLYAVLLGLAYWSIGFLMRRWDREKRFPLGPWLGCGAVAARLLHWGTK